MVITKSSWDVVHNKTQVDDITTLVMFEHQRRVGYDTMTEYYVQLQRVLTADESEWTDKQYEDGCDILFSDITDDKDTALEWYLLYKRDVIEAAKDGI